MTSHYDAIKARLITLEFRSAHLVHGLSREDSERLIDAMRLALYFLNKEPYSDNALQIIAEKLLK